MALSAVGKYYGRKNLEVALGQKLPKLPFRDCAWRYWNAMNMAGIGVYWGNFVFNLAVGGTVRESAQLLRSLVPRYNYTTFLRYLGTNPHNSHRRFRDVWTKGGNWDGQSNFTRLLVRKQHLEPRVCVTHMQKKLKPRIRMLERELMRLIDPDTSLPHECRHQAVAYAKRRMAQLCGYQRVGLDQVAWFFQARIPMKTGTIVPIKGTGYTYRTRDNKPWEW